MFRFFLPFFFLFHSAFSNDWVVLKEHNDVVDYGVQGVFSESNNPPYRGNGGMYYYNNSIWFMCGSEELGTQYNDVWEFSLELNQYRYHFGPKNASDLGNDGNWETLGQYDENLYPASRLIPGYALNTINETFLLFGGMSYMSDPETFFRLYNFGDIWEYNPRMNMFRILKGWDYQDGYREVGTRDVFDDMNSPGKAMMGIRMMKRSEDILFFFYGGVSVMSMHVDLWEYNITSNQYRFIFGDYENGDQSSTSGLPFSESWYEERLLGNFPSSPGCYDGIFPPGRMVHNAWLYKGYYWIQAGLRYRNAGDVSMRVLSDFWRIKIDNVTSSNMQWCWIHGTYEEDLPSIHDGKEFSKNNRFGFGAAAIYFHDYVNNYFVAVTGSSENVYESAWVFNPETFEWKYTSGLGDEGPIPYGRGASFYAQVDDHSIVFCGGLYENAHSVQVGLTDVWRYQKLEYNCFDVDSESRDVCSGEGTCYVNNTCECTEYYRGTKCDDLLANKYFAEKVMPFLGAGLGTILLFVFILCCLCCAFVCLILISSPVWAGSGFKLFQMQMKGMKASKLNNIDMIIREQELLKQGGDGNTPSFLIDKHLFEIKSENIILEKMVAEGGGGAVIYLGKWKGKKICYKCFKTQKLCAKESYFEEFEKEVAIIGSISHPNLVQFFGCTLVSPRIGIVLEWCDHGDLQVYIQRGKKGLESKLPLFEKLRILGEISQALDYLHSRSIIHRDLKTNNVLLTANNTAKVTDFGLSRGVKGGSTSGESHLTKNIGTTFFMAPEIVLKDDYTNKVDVFSMSIIIFEVIFEDFDPYKIGKKGDCVELKVANSPTYRPEIPIPMKEVRSQGIRWLVRLMIRCWDAFEEERPTFEEISNEFEKNMVLMFEKEDIGGKVQQKGELKKVSVSKQTVTKEKIVERKKENNHDDDDDDDDEDDGGDDDGEGSTSDASSSSSD